MLSKMRERVTIQENSTTPDGYGGAQDGWANIASTPIVSADVMPVKGREGDDAGRLASVQAYLVTIRYRSDVTPANRLLWGSVELNIRSVTNRDQKRKYITIEADSGKSQ